MNVNNPRGIVTVSVAMAAVAVGAYYLYSKGTMRECDRETRVDGAPRLYVYYVILKFTMGGYFIFYYGSSNPSFSICLSHAQQTNNK